MARNEKDINYSCCCDNRHLHNFGGSCVHELERATKGTTCMDRMAGRRSNNFIKWCHRCKHEVPEYLETDACELCGGDIIKISNESEDKQ